MVQQEHLVNNLSSSSASFIWKLTGLSFMIQWCLCWPAVHAARQGFKSVLVLSSPCYTDPLLFMLYKAPADIYEVCVSKHKSKYFKAH